MLVLGPSIPGAWCVVKPPLLLRLGRVHVGLERSATVPRVEGSDDGSCNLSCQACGGGAVAGAVALSL